MYALPPATSRCPIIRVTHTLACTGPTDALNEFDPACGPFDIFNHEIITSVLPVLFPTVAVPFVQRTIPIARYGEFELSRKLNVRYGKARGGEQAL